MTLVYICGPMSGKPQWNFPAFDEAAALLRAVGYEVINPAEVDRALGFDPNDTTTPFTEEHYFAAMRRDIPLVMKADGVAMLHGWQLSRGANVEHDVARAIGNRAMMVEAWLYEASRQNSVARRG